MLDESTLTDRYQTTIPLSVRKVLNLSKRDKLYYSVEPDGRVLLSPVPPNESDPVVDAFLAFLAQDMVAHPERLQAIPEGLLERGKALVAGMDVDLDAPLSDDDE